MADLQTLLTVKAGQKYLKKPDLRGADLSNVNLKDVNFSEANFCNADLSFANLNNANLRDSDLSGVDLSCATLINVNFSNANLSNVNFREVKLINANLSGANLNGANLKFADLNGSNLRNTDLRRANLKQANLSNVSFVGANLNQALLTGACVEDWHISSSTKLDNIQCEYIYLSCSYKQGEMQFSERSPRDPNNTFKSREFEALARKQQETIDLVFLDGIDWQAFFQSFQELRSQYQDDSISIQTIEKKGDETFIIRLSTSASTDIKRDIEISAIETYNKNLVFLEEKYRLELSAKQKEIEIYKQQSDELKEIAKLLASRPINIESESLVTEKFSGNVNIRNASGNISNYIINSDSVSLNFENISGRINNAIRNLRLTKTEEGVVDADFIEIQKKTIESNNDFDDDEKLIALDQLAVLAEDELVPHEGNFSKLEQTYLQEFKDSNNKADKILLGKFEKISEEYHKSLNENSYKKASLIADNAFKMCQDIANSIDQKKNPRMSRKIMALSSYWKLISDLYKTRGKNGNE